MADDLDALFGAFDGDEKNTDSVEAPAVEPSDKTSKEDDMQNNVEQSTKAVSSMYASVFSSMSHSVHIKDTKTADPEPKKQEETKQIDEEREISTGTSHDKSIRSYSAWPKGPIKPEDNVPISSEPAKTYPFPLDPFQQTAINYISKNQSVLVAAHTSAGKTVTAEYAIAQSLKNGQRVVYTSPIKALSNQKYRDLQEVSLDCMPLSLKILFTFNSHRKYLCRSLLMWD